MPTPVFIEFVGSDIAPPIPSLLEGDIISADVDPILQIQMGDVVMSLPKIIFAPQGGVLTANDDIVVIETPIGAVDGVNTDFTLLGVYEPGTLEIYINGLYQGPAKFIETSGNSFELLDSPAVGDEIIAQYSRLGAGGVSMTQIVVGETPTGVIDGVNATFTTDFDFDADTLQVFLNGIRQDLIDDYILTAPNEFVFTFSPGVTEEVEVDYIKA